MEKIFVLVHGSWHGAWCFERLAALLVHGGGRVVARDLPGHGISARLPNSYLERDAAKFATEPSPVGNITQDDYANLVGTEVTRLSTRYPDAQIVLVGHSFGGVTVTRVAEAMPEALSHLVYLAAFMLPDGKAVNDFIGTPEFSTSKLLLLLKADPMATGALRLDVNSPDAAQRAQVKAAFAADVPDEQWQAVSNLLTPDEPAQPCAQPLAVTARRWGSVPRTYVKAANDQAVPPATQDLFIREADGLTGGGTTDVRVLDTSHSPFLSAPEELARILLSL